MVYFVNKYVGNSRDATLDVSISDTLQTQDGVTNGESIFCAPLSRNRISYSRAAIFSN